MQGANRVVSRHGHGKQEIGFWVSSWNLSGAGQLQDGWPSGVGRHSRPRTSRGPGNAPSQAAAMLVEPVLKSAAAAAGAWGMSLLVASPLKLAADLDALSKSLELPVSLGQGAAPH